MWSFEFSCVSWCLVFAHLVAMTNSWLAWTCHSRNYGSVVAVARLCAQPPQPRDFQLLRITLTGALGRRTAATEPPSTHQQRCPTRRLDHRPGRFPISEPTH